MNDLMLRGGWVIDGSAQPRRRLDVGIRDRVIAEMGEPGTLTGRRVVDADGLLVAPGFIDAHTHYDAQLGWDPAATPS